jgi:wyosine [tRNA(Phe)-imidazoG37] synthetase (radical SAM superfamily)
MLKRVFGPVPSRRLGQSLGIDPVPLKTCNWNCVYCQLGRTQPIVNTRKCFYQNEDILSQVEKALSSHSPGEIDWVTFVGSGETTLHAGLGEMVRGVKGLTDLPVAVITNGSLLYTPEMRDELMAADAVLPSLDAGNAALYRKINRPHPDLTYERLVDGMIRFREVFTQKLWVEVMLIRGINDSAQALEEIAAVLNHINPDEVHIVQPTRPPVETWVMPPDEDGLLRARAILGQVAQIIHPAIGAFDLGGEEDLVDAIVGIITRHPMKESELTTALEAWSPSEVRETLFTLRDSGKAQIVERQGVRFWTAAKAFYPKDDRLGSDEST